MKKLVTFLVLAGTALYAGNYNLDTAHSSVGFKVKHMMISNVSGSFDRFSGSLSYDEKAKKLTKLTGSVEVASINTANAKRDEHLRSADLFDAKTYPMMNFSLERVQEDKAHGILTIRGISKPVTLTIESSGAATDPWGNDRVGVELSGVIDRKEFGITWNKTLEAGGVLVGEKVKLEIALEGILAD